MNADFITFLKKRSIKVESAGSNIFLKSQLKSENDKYLFWINDVSGI